MSRIHVLIATVILLFTFALSAQTNKKKQLEPRFGPKKSATVKKSPPKKAALQKAEEENPASKGESQASLKATSKKIRIGTGEEFVVKFIYRVATSEIYLLPMSDYEFHYDYATTVLKYRRSTSEFNKNYVLRGDSREFVNASLILKKDTKDTKSDDFKNVLLELWTGDNLEAKFTQRVMADILKILPGGMTIQFHPLSQEQEEIARAGRFEQGTLVFTADLFKDKTYLPLNEGKAIGVVKFVKKPLKPLEDMTPAEKEAYEKKNAVDLDNIVVYEQAPNDIGLVGAVITAEPQTLLSHINVKSINRRTANMYLKNAFTELKDKDGRRVNEGDIITLDVTSDKPIIEVLSISESALNIKVKAFWDERKPELRQKPDFIIDPEYDNKLFNLVGYYKKLTRGTRVPTREEHRKLTQTVGGKAANLGLLNYLVERQNLKVKKLGIKPVLVPDTVAIPFNFYEEFIKIPQAGLDEKRPTRVVTLEVFIEETLRAGGLLRTDQFHKLSKAAPVLLTLRKAVSKAKVPPRLLALLKEMVMNDATSPLHISKIPRLRLRSSTSAEDMDGFTGAGLYDSDGVNLYKKIKLSSGREGGYDKTKPKTWEEIEEDLIEVIPRLYSGLWNDRAFMEREWFNMKGTDHLKIKAGLAVHSSFPLKDFDGEDGEMGNGVGITTNVFDPEDSNRVFINAQHYDLAVTNPPSKEDFDKVGEPVPTSAKPYASDEFLLTTFLADDSANARSDSFLKWPLEKFRATSVKGGKQVLTSSGRPDELRTLAYYLKQISDDMSEVYDRDAETFFIDSEWKIYGPDRQIIIKQARPFEPPKFN